jgi:hypothetical protein
MNEPRSTFLSWPKHMTRDHVSGLAIGFGIGCMFGAAEFADGSVRTAMIVGFAFVLVGLTIRPNPTNKSTDN